MAGETPAPRCATDTRPPAVQGDRSGLFSRFFSRLVRLGRLTGALGQRRLFDVLGGEFAGQRFQKVAIESASSLLSVRANW